MYVFNEQIDNNRYTHILEINTQTRTKKKIMYPFRKKKTVIKTQSPINCLWKTYEEVQGNEGSLFIFIFWIMACFNDWFFITNDKTGKIIVNKELRSCLKWKFLCQYKTDFKREFTRSLEGERICTLTFSVRGGCSLRLTGCSCHSRKLFGAVTLELDFTLSKTQNFDKKKKKYIWCQLQTSSWCLITIWYRCTTTCRWCWCSTFITWWLFRMSTW